MHRAHHAGIERPHHVLHRQRHGLALAAPAAPPGPAPGPRGCRRSPAGRSSRWSGRRSGSARMRPSRTCTQCPRAPRAASTSPTPSPASGSSPWWHQGSPTTRARAQASICGTTRASSSRRARTRASTLPPPGRHQVADQGVTGHHLAGQGPGLQDQARVPGGLAPGIGPGLVGPWLGATAGRGQRHPPPARRGSGPRR